MTKSIISVQNQRQLIKSGLKPIEFLKCKHVPNKLHTKLGFDVKITKIN